MACAVIQNFPTLIITPHNFPFTVLLPPTDQQRRAGCQWKLSKQLLVLLNGYQLVCRWIVDNGTSAGLTKALGTLSREPLTVNRDARSMCQCQTLQELP